jgi:Tol biopolymer transport system component
MSSVPRVFVVLGLAAVCAAAGSAASAPTGKIVFSSASGVGGKAQIWVMNANGTGRHPLSPATVYEDGPALSRAGGRIAFVRRGDIYVMSSSGSNVRRLTFSPAVEGAPAWSPDGRWIAYSSYRAGRSDIWKMRSDGSAKTRLTRTVPLEDAPDWSPDGRRIVYAGPQARIWVMNADGTGRHAVTKNALGRGVAWAPAWSPDGRRIAYEFDGGTRPVDPTNEIWVISADGSHPMRLTHNALEDIQPTWSPDGGWLAFSSARPHPGPLHLWEMRPSGKSLHRVSAATADEYQPSWSR